MMAILNRKTLEAAQLVAGAALLVLIGPSSVGRGPSAAWALEAGIMSRNRSLGANIAITASAVRCPKMELRKKPQKT